VAQRALELKTCGCSCGMHKYNANIVSNYKVAVNRNTAKIFLLKFYDHTIRLSWISVHYQKIAHHFTLLLCTH